MSIRKNIFNPTERPFEEIESAATVITKSGDNFHLGLIYRNPETEELRFLHLAWHLDLVDQDLPGNGKYLWGCPDLPEERVMDIAIRCLLVIDANSKGEVPYAFSYPNDFFNAETGQMLLGSRGVGLTCATFVMAIFHMANINLINYSSWRERKSDKYFQQYIVSQMEKNRVPKAHIEEVLKEVNGLRFRPSEVMASTVTPPEVSTMLQLEPLGLEVQSHVNETLNPVSLPTMCKHPI